MEQSSSSSPVKYVSKHTGEEIDSLLDKVKLDLVGSDLKKQVEDNTTAIGQEVRDRTNLDTTLTAAIEQEAADREKAVVDLNSTLTAELNNKVSKASGKDLSTNDYTNEDKAEVAKIKDKVDQTSLDETNKNIEGINTAIEKLVPKENINTGTFDPTSDDPAGQKTIDRVIGTEICRSGFNLAFVRRELNGKNMIDFNYVFGETPAIVGDLLGWYFAFSEWTHGSQNCSVNISYMFWGSLITHFDYYENLQKWMNNATFTADRMFVICYSLEEVGAYDFTNCYTMFWTFYKCYSLKHIHIKNFPVSFDISYSTAFEESDLVEILNNLMDLTGKTSQTLTMGNDKLALLSDEEKKIATDKNWILA